MSEQNLTILERYKALGEGKTIIDALDNRRFRIFEQGLLSRVITDSSWVPNYNHRIDYPSGVFQIYTEPVEKHDWAWALQKMQESPENMLRHTEFPENMGYFYMISGRIYCTILGESQKVFEIAIPYIIKKGWYLYV